MYSELKMCGLRRENSGGPLGPFHKTGLTGIKAILYTGTQGLLFVPQPVEVYMKDPARGAAVFIDDGKSGAGYPAGDLQPVAQGMDEGGLAGAHFSMKGKYTREFGGFQETGGRPLYVRDVKNQFHCANINCPRPFLAILTPLPQCPDFARGIRGCWVQQAPRRIALHLTGYHGKCTHRPTALNIPPFVSRDGAPFVNLPMYQ